MTKDKQDCEAVGPRLDRGVGRPANEGTDAEGPRGTYGCACSTRRSNRNEPPAKKAPGRPALPPGAGKTARVELRVRPDTKAVWQAKADTAGMTLQAWIEWRCAGGRAK